MYQKFLILKNMSWGQKCLKSRLVSLPDMSQGQTCPTVYGQKCLAARLVSWPKVSWSCPLCIGKNNLQGTGNGSLWYIFDRNFLAANFVIAIEACNATTVARSMFSHRVYWSCYSFRLHTINHGKVRCESIFLTKRTYCFMVIESKFSFYLHTIWI